MNKRIFHMIISVCLFIAVQEGRADNIPTSYSPPGTECLAHDNAYIAWLAKEVDTVEKTIPTTPTEKVALLKLKVKAFDDAYSTEGEWPANVDRKESNKLMRIVLADPYYLIWHLKINLQTLRRYLDGMVMNDNNPFITYPDNIPAEQLRRTIKYLSQVMYVVSELEASRFNNNSVVASTLNDKEKQQLVGLTNIFRNDFQDFMTCKLYQAMDKQRALTK